MSIDEEDPLSNVDDDVPISHPGDHNSLLQGDTTDVYIKPKYFEKVIKIGKCLSSEEAKEHSNLLHSHLNIFAWTYEDMPSIDESILVHNIILCPDTKPVKQEI